VIIATRKMSSSNETRLVELLPSLEVAWIETSFWKPTLKTDISDVYFTDNVNRLDPVEHSAHDRVDISDF